MKFIAKKTSDGEIKGRIRFYCYALEVSRQAFYEYLKRRKSPWKYEKLASEMWKIHDEDECNNTYGRVRMYQALRLKKESGKIDVDIPSEATVRKIMCETGLIQKPINRQESRIILSIVTFMQTSRWKRQLQTSQRFLQKTENSMFRQFLTALTLQYWEFHLQTI